MSHFNYMIYRSLKRFYGRSTFCFNSIMKKVDLKLMGARIQMNFRGSRYPLSVNTFYR